MKDTINIDLQNGIAWENRRNNLRSSFDVAIRTQQESINQNYHKGIADSSKILGYCYWRFSDYSKSLQHSLKAIELYKDLNDKKGEADTLNSVGAVYMFNKDHQKRLECNLKCLELRKEIGDFNGVSGSMNNIGETYIEKEDYINAEKWLLDCLNYPHSSVDSRAWAYHNLGRIQQKKRNWKEARHNYFKCLELTSIDKYDVLTCETYLKIVEISIEEGALEIAEDFGLMSLKLSKEIGSEEYKKEALFLLSIIMEEKKDLTKALEYHKLYHQTHTKIFNEKNSQQIKDIGYQYEIDRIRREAEIERLKKVELVKAYEEIEEQNHLIEQKNKDITDSIRYAKKIQQALLVPEDQVSSHLPEHFIIFKPKDIVSGDFYWAVEKNNFLYLAVCDCTGHGVPGAFLTVLGASFLNEIVAHAEKQSPAEILYALRERFIQELGETETRDGMDVSLVSIDLTTNEFVWAGAIRPLYIFRKEQNCMESFSGDKQSICFVENKEDFTNVKGVLNVGDILYLFSDGYADQFGGARGKKFKMKQLIELLSSIHQEPMVEQKKLVSSAFEEWKGAMEQIDDVCFIGLRI